MPANIISINGVPDYYVGDSGMPELIAWLDSNGIKMAEKETVKEND